MSTKIHQKCPRKFTHFVHENPPFVKTCVYVLSKRILSHFAAFFEMFSTCKAGIMPYAHGVLHMTKEDSIFSPDTVTDTAHNCPENIAKNSILLHSGLNPAWHFWLSTRFSCCLKMKSVENILGYIREQFYKLFKKIS